ncbi:MAG: retroviral-like aspartic protease family protein [Pseudomonadota bacterium]
MKIQLRNRMVLFILIVFLPSCTTFQTIQLINGGEVVLSGYTESVVPFTLVGHPILIKVRLNNTQKEYSFIFDTGALTLITKEVAKELDLPKGIEVEANDAGGKTKIIDMVKLDNVSVEKMKVRNCAAGVTDFPEMFPPNIAGILGSNFFKHFKVTIDYQKKELTFSKDTKPIAQQNTDIKIPFKTNMETGFAPIIECQVDEMNTTAEIDTGFPGIVALPLSLVKKTQTFKLGAVITAQGSMSGGAFGMEEESYGLRIDELRIGALRINHIPSTSHSSKNDHLLLGNKFLEKYLVILNYPAEEIILTPYGTPFETNIPTYGLALAKKDHKTLVSGIWNNSPASRSGIKPGDEVVKINSTDASTLSLMEMIPMFQDENINSLEIEYLNGKERHKIILDKGMLLPVFK